MTSEEMIALMSASNSVRDNVLIALVIVVVAMAFILPVVVAIMVVRVNAGMTKFVLDFAGRGVQANETSNRNTEAQTRAIQGQSTTMEAMNRTGLATGAAVAVVSDKISLGMEILKLLGVDVGDLAKHASNPTAGTKQKVDDMADKAEQKSPTATQEVTALPVAPVPVPANLEALTLPVTVTLTAADTPV